jgi:phage terminase large subunit
MRGSDTMQVAGRLAIAVERWGPDAVFVDQGGIGAGVIDRMRQLGHAVIGVDFGGKPTDPRFENKRAEMYWGMSAWVRDGGCLPDMKEYSLELPATTFTYANARGKLQLESKDDLRKRGLPSPDVADSLALTFAHPVAPKGLQLPKHLQRNDSPRGDYDPHAGAGPRWDYDPHSQLEGGI